MITVMRRYRRVLQIGLLFVIAAFVITSVVVSGANPFRGGGVARDSVATVNGETIPTDRFQRRYQAYLEAYAQMYKDRFSPEIAERMGLPQQVVNDLVVEAIVVQRARAEGLEITDAELNAQIQGATRIPSRPLPSRLAGSTPRTTPTGAFTTSHNRSRQVAGKVTVPVCCVPYAWVATGCPGRFMERMSGDRLSGARAARGLEP